LSLLTNLLPKQFIRKFINRLGFDVRRLHECPSATLLGLGMVPFRTILDIGANEGQFADYINRFFPTADIYSFEPLAYPFEQLSALASQNSRIHPYNLALGETEGSHDFILHTAHSPSSSFLNTTDKSLSDFPLTEHQKKVSVQATTLDSWFAMHGSSLKQEFLVKIDVQGFEDRVIRGGSSVFSVASTCIVEVCLDRLYNNQAEFGEVCRLLYLNGLRYAGNFNQVYASDGHVAYIDAVFNRSWTR